MKQITSITILSILFQLIQCIIAIPFIPETEGGPIDLPINFNPFDPNQQPLPTTLDPNVKRTCDATDNPDLCIASLEPYLKYNNNGVNTDTISLLEMQIKATEQATQIAIGMIAKLGQENNDLGARKDCKELYDDALDNLKKALMGIPARDIGTVETMLSAAITDFGTCDDGFKEGGSLSPLADYGKKLIKLVSNCLATVSLIKN